MGGWLTIAAYTIALSVAITIENGLLTGAIFGITFAACAAAILMFVVPAGIVFCYQLIMDLKGYFHAKKIQDQEEPKMVDVTPVYA